MGNQKQNAREKRTATTFDRRNEKKNTRKN